MRACAPRVGRRPSASGLPGPRTRARPEASCAPRRLGSRALACRVPAAPHQIPPTPPASQRLPAPQRAGWTSPHPLIAPRRARPPPRVPRSFHPWTHRRRCHWSATAEFLPPSHTHSNRTSQRLHTSAQDLPELLVAPVASPFCRSSRSSGRICRAPPCSVAGVVSAHLRPPTRP